MLYFNLSEKSLQYYRKNTLQNLINITFLQPIFG